MVEHNRENKQIVHVIDVDKKSSDDILKALDGFPFPLEITQFKGITPFHSVPEGEADLLIICMPARDAGLPDASDPGTLKSLFKPGIRILYITESPRDINRLFYFKHGASDVLVKPFSKTELHHHVERLLHSAATRFRTISSEKAMIEFLEKMISTDTRDIIPALDPSSHYGHFFPDVARVFFKTSRDMDFLEKLAESDLLVRKVFNRIRACPLCDNNHINIREVCPNCNSIDITQTEMIHHFSCGHVDKISAFKKGADLICQKCNKHLRHIGLDYEKPSTHFQCNDCSHIFSDPKVEFQCLFCGLTLKVNDSAEKIIYQYALTALADQAVKAGKITGVNLASLLYNKYTNLYSKQYFEIEFNREIVRWERYHQDFTFLLIRIEGLEDIRRKTPGQLEYYVNDVFRALNSNLRELDTTCIWDTDLLSVILAGTGKDGALVVVNRMHQKITALEHLLNIRKPEISISMIPGSDGLKTTTAFIEKAISELDSV